ncbi:tyrosine-type recombinase/integrase [Geminicoccus flavidas]|uniref:tyrosine-type recombinase/integrase n=1 Tax=Geminicoccus flavidas TaxID=2506407 RepID=UPI0013595ED5|nr:site-specific integrase [Geminicoccus flavidas]
MGFSTQREVDRLALPAGKNELFVADEGCRGLYVRLQGTKRTWVVRYDSGGRRRKVVVADVPAMTLREARAEATRLIAKVRDGGDPLSERAAKASAPKKLLLGDLIARFIANYAEKHQRPKTLVETRRSLDVHMQPLHDRPAEEIGRRELAERFQELVETSGPVMANRVRAATSTLYSWAMRQGLCEANPTIGTASPGAETKRDRVLSIDELRHVWQALEGGNPDFRDITRLLILLGQRKNEVAGMAWSELDLNRALWVLPAARTKNGLAHEVPLPSQVMRLLQKRVADRDPKRDLVFGRRAGPFSGWTVAKAALDRRLGVLHAEKRLGRRLRDDEKPDPSDSLAGWTLHDLRRSFVTHLNEIDVDPGTVELIVNHVSGHRGGISAVYNHSKRRPQKKAALQLWADHIDSIVAQHSVG